MAPLLVYVSPRGDDANPGTSERPCRTVAVALARAAPSPGWRLHLAAGTYDLAVPVRVAPVVVG